MPLTEQTASRSLLDVLDGRFEENLATRRRHESKWRESLRFIAPHRPRDTITDTDRPDKDRSAILDETGTWAHGIARAGLVSIMANPSRKWHDLRVPDPQYEESDASRAWLRLLRDHILGLYERSNFYTALAQMLGDELLVATSPLGQFEVDDPTRVVRFEVPPPLSYAISQDDLGNPNIFQREITMTVRQVLARFGEDAVSTYIKDRAQQGGLADLIEIRHMILPNPDYLPQSMLTSRLPVQEVYWEHRIAASRKNSGTPYGGPGTMGQRMHDRPLATGGYHEFPYAVARWEKNLEDTYGINCPAYDALGSIKQLQVQEDKTLLGLEMAVEPPMAASSLVDQREVSLVPREVTRDPAIDGSGTGGTRPLHVPNLSYRDLEEKSEKVRRRIERAFMVPIFLSLVTDERRQRATATEIDQMVRELTAVLGPVSSIHSDDVFDKTTDRTLGIVLRRASRDWRAGRQAAIPPPPPELAGRDIRPVYVSEVVQAQKGQSLLGLDRLVSTFHAAAQMQPEILDRLDVDELAEEYRDGLGVSPVVIRGKDGAAEIRASRQQAMQAAQLQENAGQLAGAAKDLSETSLGSDSALDRMVASAAG